MSTEQDRVRKIGSAIRLAITLRSRTPEPIFDGSRVPAKHRRIAQLAYATAVSKFGLSYGEAAQAFGRTTQSVTNSIEHLLFQEPDTWVPEIESIYRDANNILLLG